MCSDGLRFPQKANCPRSFCQLPRACPLLIAGINWMENHSSQTQIQFCFPDLQGSSDRLATWRDEGTEPGCGPCEDAAGHGGHQLAGKLTTNTYAWDDPQAEMNKHENEQIITSIYMQGEVTYIEKWHTAINTFCCLYRTVYNKKRSIYRNQYPLLLVNLIFFVVVSSHVKRSKNILFFWEEWVGDINLSFFFFLKMTSCFFLSTPNPIWTSHCLGVVSQAVVDS